MSLSDDFLAEFPAARLFGYPQAVPEEAVTIIRSEVIPRAPTIRDPLGAGEVLFGLDANP